MFVLKNTLRQADPEQEASTDSAEGLLDLADLWDDEETEQEEPTDETAEQEEQADEPAEQESEESDEGEEPEEAEEQAEPDEDAEPTVTVMVNGKPKEMTYSELLSEQEFEVTVNGEAETVAFPELVNGYQRMRDYTRKTQEISQMQDKLTPYIDLVAHVDADPGLRDHIGQYFQHGSDPDLDVSDEDLADLIDVDPEKAAKVLQYRKGRSKKTKAQQVAQERAKELHKAKLQREAEKLVQYVPDWNDVKKDVAEFLRSEHGFSDAELQQLADSRVARLAVEAWRGATKRTPSDAKPKSQARAKKGNPPIRLAGKRKASHPPRVAGAGQGKPTKSRKADADAFRQLRDRGGSTDDFARLIANSGIVED